jgi:hypothetical protein
MAKRISSANRVPMLRSALRRVGNSSSAHNTVLARIIVVALRHSRSGNARLTDLTN